MTWGKMVDNPVDSVWTNPAGAGGKSYPPFVRKIIHNLSTSRWGERLRRDDGADVVILFAETRLALPPFFHVFHGVHHRAVVFALVRLGDGLE